MSTVPIDLRDLPLRRDIQVPVDSAHRDPLTLTYRDDAGAAALVLTGVTWALKLSTAPGGDQIATGATITTWTASGVKVDNAAAGQLTVWLTAADVALAGVGEHYWSLTATFPSDHGKLPGMVRMLLHGRVTVTPKAVG